MHLIFATNNTHKLKEIRNLLDDSFTLLSLKDIKCFDEIPEDHNTLEANASQKAFYVYNKLIKGLLSAAPLIQKGEEGGGLDVLSVGSPSPSGRVGVGFLREILSQYTQRNLRWELLHHIFD